MQFLIFNSIHQGGSNTFYWELLSPFQTLCPRALITPKSQQYKTNLFFVLLTDTYRVTVIPVATESNEIEYLVDSVSLTEIPTNPQWREEADARIDTLRKGNIRVK